MARRAKTSPIEDLVDLLSRLPWWACLVFATASYAVLHTLATRPLPTVQPGQISDLVTAGLWRGLAAAGQYILPFAGVLAAIMSAVGRRKRAQLVANVAGSRSADALEGMSWQEFEQLVGEAYRLQGFTVRETGGGGADGGIDLVLRRGSEKFLVQCKQWKALKVPVQVVRELYGAMAASGAAGGHVVTSGSFTKDAREFADGRNINLVDGAELFHMLRQAKAARAGTPATPAPSKPTPAAYPPTRTTPPAPPPAFSSGHATAPACSRCSRPMTLRTARRGANAGNAFWGCTGYPSCRETQPA